ncbi:hypothetical protein OS21_37780 [Dickeya oryzae]
MHERVDVTPAVGAGTRVAVAAFPVCPVTVDPHFLDAQTLQTSSKAVKYRQSTLQYGRFS